MCLCLTNGYSSSFHLLQGGAPQGLSLTLLFSPHFLWASYSNLFAKFSLLQEGAHPTLIATACCYSTQNVTLVPQGPSEEKQRAPKTPGICFLWALGRHCKHGSFLPTSLQDTSYSLVSGLCPFTTKSFLSLSLPDMALSCQSVEDSGQILWTRATMLDSPPARSDSPTLGVGNKAHPVPSAWTCCLKISLFGREGSGTGPTFPKLHCFMSHQAHFILASQYYHPYSR